MDDDSVSGVRYDREILSWIKCWLKKFYLITILLSTSASEEGNGGRARREK